MAPACSDGTLFVKEDPMLLETLRAYQRRDPAARSKLEVLLLDRKSTRLNSSHG